MNKGKKKSLFFAFFEFSGSFISSGNHARETGEWTDVGDTNSSVGGKGAINCVHCLLTDTIFRGIRCCYIAQSGASVGNKMTSASPL